MPRLQAGHDRGGRGARGRRDADAINTKKLS